MKLYNTLGRSLQEFKPLKENQVGIYSCGPTVYWNQHLGHMYAYVQWDCLVRTLKYLGYQTKWVMNITDVGHLTSDADTGEDKMEKGAKREGLSVWQIAERYLAQFLESLDQLNIPRPDVLCRATEHIPEQIDLISQIEKNGFTYRTKVGLVFDTGKFPGYADFAGLKLDQQAAGARVEVDPQKKSPHDFLLWVTNQPEHLMQWDSPWGRGFPGWHIECTAMSVKYLGERFDIHTGGQEHIPVHHTNEVAQGFGAFGQQTANYWLHNGWLNFKGEKMSKSLGNFTTVQDLVAKGYSPLAMRYLTLTSHYRTGLDFNWESLQGAQRALERLAGQVVNLPGGEPVAAEIAAWEKRFTAALRDDLNLPKALATVWELVKSNLGDSEKSQLLVRWDQVLGLRLSQKKTSEPIPESVRQLASAREKQRAAKNWDKADKLRQQVERLGYEVRDGVAGVEVSKKWPRS